MLISCLCPTYNRYPLHSRLVEEAVASFIYQYLVVGIEYELILCNDAPGQTLVYDHPRVKVLNVAERFPTLSDKLSYMIQEAQGSYLCRWDDDDISLPWRLRKSVEKVKDDLEWRAENYWWVNGENPLQHVVSPGNTHVMSIWHREVLEKIGGYPPKRSGDEDQMFNKALRNAGLSGRGEVLPHEDVFYVYRWGVSPSHLSGRGGGDNLQRHWDSIGLKPVAKGQFTINPRWHRNYVMDANEAIWRLKG